MVSAAKVTSQVLATSKITGQGQVSVPVEVRRLLGVAPGSMLEWEVKDGLVVVRRRATYSFDDMHRALFPDGPPKRRTDEELNQAGALHVRAQHARGRY